MNPDEFFAKVQAILDGMICDGSICKECICFQKEETGECRCDDGNDQFGFPDGCSGFVCSGFFRSERRMTNEPAVGLRS